MSVMNDKRITGVHLKLVYSVKLLRIMKQVSALNFLKIKATLRAVT